MDLVQKILATISTVRAQSVDNLVEPSGQVGDILLTSPEIVTVLVVLEDEIGINPGDPKLLKDIEPQTIDELLEFIKERNT